MRFKTPATSDVFVKMRLDDEQIGAISAAADATGKGEFELDGPLTTADGTLVAESHGVYPLRATAALVPSRRRAAGPRRNSGRFEAHRPRGVPLIRRTEELLVGEDCVTTFRITGT